MLSSIGRSATGRLASTNFATSFARSLVLRAATKPQSHLRAIYGPSYRAVRGLASAARTKKAPASATAKTTSTKTTAKKPATKTTKAKAAPKAAAKTTTKAKAKGKAKPKAKPKATPRRKRPAVSPERKAILERQALKRIALFSEPKTLPTQPFRLFIYEKTRGKGDGQRVIEKMAALSQEFKALPSHELERLKSAAEQNRLNNAAAYKAWVESHPVQAIYDANKARASLKKKHNVPKGQVKVIHDDRLPKRPASPFSLFTKARWASGDLSEPGARVGAVASRIAKEWKDLTAAERQPYEDLARSQVDHYVKETDAVLNLTRRPKATSPQ